MKCGVTNNVKCKGFEIEGRGKKKATAAERMESKGTAAERPIESSAVKTPRKKWPKKVFPFPLSAFFFLNQVLSKGDGRRAKLGERHFMFLLGCCRV